MCQSLRSTAAQRARSCTAASSSAAPTALSADDVRALSPKELKKQIRARGLDATGLLEKTELVELLLENMKLL